MKLSGHAAVWNTFTEIDSAAEGRFMERIAPGAFKRSIAEDRDRIRCLFQHGSDPQVGSKPLGAFTDLREDKRGVYYAVDMFDTSYNRDLLPGLRASQYGASFRFRTVREEFVSRPGRSAWNADGIPERTLIEVELFELGPVTFGAYQDATAGVRSSAVSLAPIAGTRLELHESGLGHGPTPVTLKRLRRLAEGDDDAKRILRAIERGERVELIWKRGGEGLERGRVISAGRTSETRNALHGSSPTQDWRLGGPDWRLT